ncbi:MAG: hypothetical protein JW731_09485 [Bacteroidales bacterium]|nr:hypothetical protein [Bacteroidales bacterium]
MSWYILFSIISLIICLTSLWFHLFRLIRFGHVKEFSYKTGDTKAAVRYAFTGAMSPAKKESAFLHLPTYTAGIFYHLGTFLCILLFILFLFGIEPAGWIRSVVIGFLLVTGMSGLSILIKRIANMELRALSNPDDYISNILVTAVQLLTAGILYYGAIAPVYFIAVSLLLLYLPLGKLKHTLYFFAARYHLGIFYGWRGVWPPK